MLNIPSVMNRPEVKKHFGNHAPFVQFYRPAEGTVTLNCDAGNPLTISLADKPAAKPKVVKRKVVKRKARR